MFATCLLPYIDKDLPPLKIEELEQLEREAPTKESEVRDVRKAAVSFFEQFRGERSYIDAMRDLGYKWKNPLLEPPPSS